MNVLLLTEDSRDPVLFKESAADLSSEHTLTAVESIGEVWKKLTLRQSPLPNLIFLQVELSRSYDHELVEIFKSNPELKAAPIVVFADSADMEEVVLAYSLQIACFVVLPIDLTLRRDKIRACLEFWSKHAELPELRRWWPQAVES